MITKITFSGHEDLRQDERVMQLFSLVNTLLSVDTNSFKRRLHIQRYPVIPLAPNAGLLGWVRDSDTLHVLIRDYRDSRKVLLNIEYRLMLQVCTACFIRKLGLTASADGTRL
jgi:serine/threonine-protein kinase mTOR